ncbi:MAG: cytochrome c oxidase assembly protein [Actinobacteria bacterium]|nr:cytochrome c oxidase assembly protein [Actinomycetota bacterium]
MDMNSVPTSTFWSQWQFAPQITVPAILLLVLYLRLTHSSEHASTTRQKKFFISGVGTILLVAITPIGVRAGDLYWCHMVLHVTVMMITGPLLVLGTPQSFRPKNWLFITFTHPLLSWILYAAVMVGVHLPGPHEFMMNHPWIHSYLEIPGYIVVSYLFYFNLLDRNLVGRRIGPALSVISLFIMMIPETLTGFFIYAAPHSIYGGMYSLNDQRRGGSIMWSGGMIVDTVWMAFAVFHWIKSEERASLLLDEEMQREAS